MKIELVGGPLDGTLYEIPEYSYQVFFAKPPRDTRFWEYDEGLPEDVLQYEKLVYTYDHANADRAFYKLGEGK